jgi:hypothetical protein
VSGGGEEVEGITRLNALVHLPEFVLDVQEIRSLSCSHTLKSPHDVVISLDNALWMSPVHTITAERIQCKDLAFTLHKTCLLLFSGLKR